MTRYLSLAEFWFLSELVTGIDAATLIKASVGNRDDDVMVAERKPIAAASVDGADNEEPGLGSARLSYLDNLKIVLTVGVIVAHAAMTYGAVGTWVYEEPSLSGVAEGVLSVFVGVGAMFGLGLFFLLAGMLTTAPLIRRGPRSFLAPSSRRARYVWVCH